MTFGVNSNFDLSDLDEFQVWDRKITLGGLGSKHCRWWFGIEKLQMMVWDRKIAVNPAFPYY